MNSTYSKKTSLLRKKDLRSTINLKEIFEEINQHLYAKLKNTDTDTRSRSKEVINLLLCKLVDEITKSEEEILEIQININESHQSLAKRIKSYYNREVKEYFSNIFAQNENINLTDELIYLIIQNLEYISLVNSSRDLFNDAFEIFVSKIIKEEGGQFFTPSNITKFMVEYLKPQKESKILDPACGHGGFLIASLEYVKKIEFQKMLEKNGKVSQNMNSLNFKLFGIDKDSFLSKICAIYLEILSGEKPYVFCEDSLSPNNYSPEMSRMIKENHFDFIFTNPPFGSKIPIDDKKILQNYELGHAWKTKSIDGWIKTDKILKQQTPQILFIERCVQLLRQGGKLGIVLPEGIFGNPSDRYIWEFLKQNGQILGVISLDQNTFQPYTCNKTSILFYKKTTIQKSNYTIDFAIVENIGHDKDGKVLYKLNNDGSIIFDSEGNPIINDELENLDKNLAEAGFFDEINTQKIFKIHSDQIKENIFIPNYYIGVEKQLNLLEENPNFNIYTIQDLIEKKVIYSNKNGNIPRGDEIGSKVYGLGDIPFIRTSEISHWNINLDSNKKTSEEVYNQYKEKQNIEEGDILLVKDGGSNLIGNIAYISDLDTKIIIQSHIYQLKVLPNNLSIDKYLLLYLFSLDIIQEQIKAITFVQGTIATIGDRIKEIKLPIPKNSNKCQEISKYIKDLISQKTQLRKKILNLSLQTFNPKSK